VFEEHRAEFDEYYMAQFQARTEANTHVSWFGVPLHETCIMIYARNYGLCVQGRRDTLEHEQLRRDRLGRTLSSYSNVFCKTITFYRYVIFNTITRLPPVFDNKGVPAFVQETPCPRGSKCAN